MTGSAERRGPRRLDADAVDEFLGRERLAALCVEAASGELEAVPVWLDAGREPPVRLLSADPILTGAAARRGDPACVVADEFESYEEIHGVIVQGNLGEDNRGEAGSAHVVMAVTRAVGFSFAGTLPPHLIEPPA